MGFEKNGTIFSKSYDVSDTPLVIDLANNFIKYENIGITVTRNTTTNFDEPESLVVLECVNRLLTKGYHPHHIELEPHWKLGRGASGGFGDIWIRTISESEGGKIVSSLMIIECKTYGNEFTSEWRKTLNNGGQLFTYFQQEQSTKFLCLYTSCFKDDAVDPLYHLINVQDNLQLLETQKSLASYAKAQNSFELFSVWRDTYKCDFFTVGIFEKDIPAYEIGKTKFSVSDLREVDDSEIRKLYNEFALILRQHNVSGKENAFDKLVNLFLAKVVDETNNQSDLHFYWKGSVYDDDFQLQDRLQRLYRDGMKKFLGEEVTYIENQQIETAFRRFVNDPDATKSTILEYFRALKFFSDNDFSFISVHNEKLFYQNAAVLKKVVQMLQNIKLKSSNDNQNQFLGDLFEGFLTKGVKQSEGQYFTPMPIVRFLVSSLPLEHIVNSFTDIPKVIDYACGAGHFLTEYAVQIKPIVQSCHPHHSITEYYSNIFGIEKEYRLSKVAKVAAFMYGHDEINIVYADALSRIENIDENSFSILIANPPYSVSGFLDTLSPNERKSYNLFTNNINIDKNNAIEAFFIERASQLIKKDGVAAIILPASILNKTGIYERARNILLCSFDIVAISEFSSKTFGKTPTSTVALFLRRKETIAPDSEHYLNRVNSWFSNHDNGLLIYDDYADIEAYCQHCGLNHSDYIEFLKGNLTEAFLGCRMINEYIDSFDSNSASAMKGVNEQAKLIRKKFKDKTQKGYFKRLSREEQNKIRTDAIFQFIREIEKEKLYYFLIASNNSCPVIIAKSPISNSDAKKYLGYEWSDTRGKEGLQYLHVAKTNGNEDEDSEDDTITQIRGIQGIQTPLFNPQNLFDKDKINTIIRSNFLGEEIIIPESLEPFVTETSLVDLIDFSLPSFTKEIKTSPIDNNIPQTKFPIIRLQKILGKVEGAKTKVDTEQILSEGTYPVISQDRKNYSSGFYNSDPITDLPLIIFGDHSCVLKYVDKPFVRGADGTQLIKSKTKEINIKYLYYYLLTVQITNSHRYERHFKYLKRLYIPKPDTATQTSIIEDCDLIMAEVESARKRKDQLSNSLNKLLSGYTPNYTNLGELVDFINDRIPYSSIIPNTYISTENLLTDCRGYSVYDGVPIISSVISFKENDILLSNIRPYLCKMILSSFAGGCNPDVLVMRVIDKDKVLPKFLYLLLANSGFFEYIMTDIKGMKMPRGKVETIKRFRVPLPANFSDQNIIASKADEIFKGINECDNIIENSVDKISNTVRKYLL